MALINTTTTGVLGSTFYGDGSGNLTVQQNGVNVNTITSAPTFMAYTLTQQTISHNSATKVTLNTEEWDTGNCFDTSLSRFTPNVAGYYNFTVQVRFDSSLSFTNMWTAIYKNGAVTYRGFEFSNSPGATYFPQQQNTTHLVYLNGSTDYVEVYIYQANSSSASCAIGYTQTPYCNRLYGFLARAA